MQACFQELKEILLIFLLTHPGGQLIVFSSLINSFFVFFEVYFTNL